MTHTDQLPKVAVCGGCSQPLAAAVRTLVMPGVCSHGLLLDSNIEKCLHCGTETVRSKQRREAVEQHLRDKHPPLPRPDTDPSPDAGTQADTGVWTSAFALESSRLSAGRSREA